MKALKDTLQAKSKSIKYETIQKHLVWSFSFSEDTVKNVLNQTIDGPHLVPYTPPPPTKKFGSQRVPSNVWLPIFFKISYFMSNRRKKLIQNWNLRVSKWWHFIFWGVNYPYNYIFMCNFIVTSFVFEIWLKCLAEYADKHLW